MRVLNRFSGIRDFPTLKLGARDFTTKSGRDSGLKVCAEGGMPKITLGITGLLEFDSNLARSGFPVGIAPYF